MVSGQWEKKKKRRWRKRAQVITVNCMYQFATHSPQLNATFMSLNVSNICCADSAINNSCNNNKPRYLQTLTALHGCKCRAVAAFLQQTNCARKWRLCSAERVVGRSQLGFGVGYTDLALPIRRVIKINWCAQNETWCQHLFNVNKAHNAAICCKPIVVAVITPKCGMP